MSVTASPRSSQTAPAAGASRYDVCRWLNDPQIGRWHLPGCMGAAVYGPSGCTCQKTPRQSLEERFEAMEAQVATLVSALASSGPYSAPQGNSGRGEK